MTTLRRFAPLATIVSAGLLFAAFWLGGGTPDVNDSGTKVQAFYADHRTGQLVSMFLLLYGVLLAVFLAAGLRRRLAADGRDLLTTAGFGGALLLAAGGGTGAGLTWALSDDPSTLDPAAAQALNAAANSSFILAILGVAVFMLGNGIAIVRSRALPRWLGWAAIVIGVVAATPIGWTAFIAICAWAVVASIVIAVRDGRGVPSRVPAPQTTA
jgi:hypothetical protein